MATMLMGRPSLPSDHLALGIDAGFRIFRTTMHVMQMAYEAIREDNCKLRIALNAALEPRLIIDSRTVQTSVSKVALTGTCTLMSILEIHREKGKPPSRANDHACRAQDAVKDTFPTIRHQMAITVRMFVPMLVSGMATWNMYRNGYPVGSFRASSTDGIANRIEIRKIRPVPPLM